ncbi:Ger(x)C family spore germination protein [Brevibacillus sp. B_LB10_24]|uniref:Ger(x)C family spore germination protein n=1 Tax=Brevibacillus sp. B_LB10_24 TaxID=3380645 RepID=UPI0038B81D11
MGINKWSKPTKLLFVIVLTVPFLAGCWDSMELDKRAVVLGLSIDEATPQKAKQESEITHLHGKFPTPKKEMVQVNAQIALPGQIPLGPGESGGQTGAGNPRQTVWPIEVVGHTIDDAMMNLQQQLSSKLFFGHLRVVVVSEKIAKKGLQNINDYLRRNSEVRRTTWMLISNGEAKNVMRAAPKLGRLPTLYLLRTMLQAVKMGKFPNDFLGLFWSATSAKGQEGYLPYIELKKEENVEIKGMAYFKGNKMVGVTKPLEIAAFMGIKGLNPAGYRTFVKVPGTSTVVNLYATQRKAKTNLKIIDGRPHFHLFVSVDTNLEEVIGASIPIDTPAILSKIEREDERSAEKFYKDLIKQTQAKGSDIFGFGEYVRAKEPKYWNQNIRTKENWQKMYKDISVDIKVKINIRRVGMKAV